MALQPGDDLLRLEGLLWLWTRPVGVRCYDLDFDTLFACRRPLDRPQELEVTARIGAIPDYAKTWEALRAENIRLIHSPEEHLRATWLPRWYPLLEDLTPKSLWFSQPPDPEEVGEALGWPVFMKGARQTSRHQRRLSILESPDDMRRALDDYARDPILQWQDIVCRAFAPLRQVEDPQPERIPSSFEFRSIWWRGQLAGIGRYWWEGIPYTLSPSERRAAIAIAGEASRRLDIPFLVIDVAQREDGAWIVIECNDGQESGLAGISPLALWQTILQLEARHLGP